MPNESNVKHVFVLMLENRSFDGLLGFSGITATDVVSKKRRTIPQPTGEYYYGGQNWPVTSPGINPMPLDPGHEFPDTLEQLCGQGATYPSGGPYPPITNSGFVSNYALNGGGKVSGSKLGDPLCCFSKTQVPVITALAEAFCICDGWCSSMPGPTWPNRLFVHAASSGGLDHSPSAVDIAYYMAFGYSFENGTIFDRLEQMNLPWRIYEGDSWPLSFALKNMTKYWLEGGHFEFFDKFASDVQSTSSPYAPVYTFIEPSYGAITSNFTCGTSQHPLDDIARGEWLIKCTYEAIRNSPVWDTSLLIVTWDEHGGFFDHVAPPGTAMPPGDKPTWPNNNQSGFTFSQYGVRVPTLVVSPYILPNAIDGRLYDHTTVLATLEKIFGIEPLTARDRSASDLTSLLNTVSTTAPTKLPEPAPQVSLPGCQQFSSCGDLPKARVAYTIAGIAPDDHAMDGNLPGFVHVALQRDLAISDESVKTERIARAQAVTTRAEARQYLLEVAQRLQSYRRA